MRLYRDGELLRAGQQAARPLKRCEFTPFDVNFQRHASGIEALFRRSLPAEQRRELFDLLSALRKTALEETP